MFIEELRKAKKEPFEPFRVIVSSGQVFDICYFDHFLVLDHRRVLLGIPDPFRRDMLDRTVRVHESNIVSIEPLPVPQAQTTGST